MEIIEKYYSLTNQQKSQIGKLGDLYQDWNQKINVISRKDIDNLYERHVLHSLAIMKYMQFPDESQILDLGTGGGLPGIPLAIMYPHCKFHLVDSVGKKLKVIEAIVEELGITNIQTTHERVENLKRQYHFVVTRAVAKTEKLLMWTRGKYKKQNIHEEYGNGLIALKGGNVMDEVGEVDIDTYMDATPLSDYFSEEFFEEKYLLYVSAR